MPKYWLKYKASVEFDMEVEASDLESAKELSYGRIDTTLGKASDVVFDEINLIEVVVM